MKVIGHLCHERLCIEGKVMKGLNGTFTCYDTSIYKLFIYPFTDLNIVWNLS